jgi:DMSO/TMAO reductase YedYZ molybdopterin-dependent catalytic subunit
MQTWLDCQQFIPIVARRSVRWNDCVDTLTERQYDSAGLARATSHSKEAPAATEQNEADRGRKLTVRARDAAGRPQMAEGSIPRSGGITPNDEFFIVHHYAPADVDGSEWSIDIEGTGGKRRSISGAELKSLPERSVTVLLECAGLSRGHLPEPKPGTQFGHGLVGTAVWTGARLSDVLDLAGVARDFHTLVVSGADAGTAQPENIHSDFSKGMPREKVLADDTLLAWAMNGQPLAYLHGGPFRVVVPGWFGVWWVKWPRRIEAKAAGQFDGFWQTSRYTYQSEDGAVQSVVQSLLPRSLIVSPDAGSRVARGPVHVEGVAWAGESAVARVEITTDAGKTWSPAQIAAEYGRWAWSRWRATVEFTGPAGLRRLAVRCTDASGRTQDWQSSGNRLGYANNGIHTIKLDVVV